MEVSVLKIDHVGIIVRDLDKAVKLYKELLDVPIVFEERIKDGYRPLLKRNPANWS
jgi:catechol 2,3-dioxygenase-like lactoylglutathione lyase family enzyme